MPVMGISRIASKHMTRLAFVTDQLATQGGYAGAEKVLDLVVGEYPGIPIYTTVYHEGRMPEHFKQWDIQTSFIQRLPKGKSHYTLYLPLLPWAIESFDLQSYDLVVSFHHSVAKGALARPDATHICYCHSPGRYLWDQYWTYVNRVPPWQAMPFKFINPFMRVWDTITANRVDHFIANSSCTAKRIEKYYRREATILYPPVETHRFYHKPEEDFYLMVGRLVHYKGFDIAIEAFNQLKEKLVIVGAGPEMARLKRLAGPTIEFKGRTTDEEVTDLMSRCKGFIFPSEEDFGMVMVEAQAAGKHVVVLNRGGAKDIIIPGETGLWVADKTPDAFARAVKLAEKTNWSPATIQANAARFSQETFINGFKAIMEEHIEHKIENLSEPGKQPAAVGG